MRSEALHTALPVLGWATALLLCSSEGPDMGGGPQSVCLYAHPHPGGRHTSPIPGGPAEEPQSLQA